ncbi:branched-chain amino acid ABC transporter permease [Skermanella pratensis]|uniref:branched-chain amino acid ABC transporter permease n=1 Tax=Skermanella pratensis TaxID=2233999 RepID=UPI0013015F4C|nr:branched-chain amino acid ABC transporter permease [Skermanella pratensis]
MTGRPFLPAALASAATVAVLLAAGLLMPRWLLFLGTIAASYGIVTLGIVLLMRSGVVSFGQGLVYAAGGYVAGLAYNRLGVTDAVVLILVGGAAAALAGAVVGPLLARYRGIFFSMLTLALSMVLYGALVKSPAIGGSDGFNVGRPTMLGWAPPDAYADYSIYALAMVVTGIVAFLATVYFRSARGLVSLAIRDNDLRVEYLGASVQAAIAVNFTLAAALGGIGGALTVMALGHIDPNFAYWTTSGEFVFVAILSGHHGVVAVFIASVLLELVRSFASMYFPHMWQFSLGVFLLLVILFLPRGIGSLWSKRAVAARGNRAPAVRSARGEAVP